MLAGKRANTPLVVVWCFVWQSVRRNNPLASSSTRSHPHVVDNKSFELGHDYQNVAGANDAIPEAASLNYLQISNDVGGNDQIRPRSNTDFGNDKPVAALRSAGKAPPSLANNVRT